MPLQGAGLVDVLEQLSNRTVIAGIDHRVVLCIAKIYRRPVAEACKMGRSMETPLVVGGRPKHYLLVVD